LRRRDPPAGGGVRRTPSAKAVVPTLLGERGNPVLSGGAFAEIDRLSGDIGARRLIEAAGADLIEVPVDDPGIHRDIDTPEALAKLWADML
jgi:molybdenum cofactor cytidylyltransferase